MNKLNRFLSLACLLASAAWASTFCDTPLDVRTFNADTIREYRYDGSTWNGVTLASSAVKPSLDSLTALADFLPYKILSSWGTSCRWTQQVAKFMENVSGTTLTPVDSTVWIRNRDDVFLSGHPNQDWAWFLADTAGWATASIKSSSYLLQPGLVRWHNYAIKYDTVITSTDTTISMGTYARIGLDSLPLDTVLKTWSTLEVSGHRYGYVVQAVKVSYALYVQPVALKGVVVAPVVAVHSEGRDIVLGPNLATKAYSILDMQGRELAKGSIGASAVRWTAPRSGIYLVRVTGLAPVSLVITER